MRTSRTSERTARCSWSAASHRRCDAADQLHRAVRSDVRLVRIRLAVVRREPLGSDPLGQLQHVVEVLACVLGEAWTLEQRLHVEPLVQQEREVAAADQGGAAGGGGCTHRLSQGSGHGWEDGPVNPVANHTALSATDTSFWWRRLG